MDNAGDRAAVVPAVYAPHAVTCFRSLRPRGVHTIGVYEHPTPAFRSRYCEETMTVPAPERDVDGYRDALLSLAERESVRTVFPMREADVYVLSKYRSEFGSVVEPRWPAFETLEIAHDRVQLVEAAREAGVAAPATTPLSETDDWTPRQIIKARYALLTETYTDGDVAGVEEPSTAVRYLDSGAAPDPGARREGPDRHAVVQEHVPGDEYAFWALYADGEPVATCQKHQIRGVDFKGGTSVYRRTVDIPALETAGRRLLDHLDWDGFASVQFVRDRRTGEFTVLEINPRVWVSVACPVLAGVDFPAYYMQLATGDPVRSPASYETGIGTHRLGGELVYLRSFFGEDDSFVEPPSVAEATGEILTSLYSDPHFDYLTLDDPQPFVDDVGRWLSTNAMPALRERLPAVGHHVSADESQSGP